MKKTPLFLLFLFLSFSISSYAGEYYSQKSLSSDCTIFDFSINPSSSWGVSSSSIDFDNSKIYKVGISSGQTYIFKTGCGDGASASFKTNLELYDENCFLLVVDNEVCETDGSKIEWTATYTGDAYLKVSGLNDTYGDYTLAYKIMNDSGCSAESPYSSSDHCYQIVIAKDPYCCNSAWDHICDEAYHACNECKIPSIPGIIGGLTTVCQGETFVEYTVSEIDYATNYVWTLPKGVTGYSNTNTIIVDFGLSAVSGNISVKGVNECGDGIRTTLAVTVKALPDVAGMIDGKAIVCQGETSVLYSVSTIANAVTYEWTLPNGASGSSNTNTIEVNFGLSAISGDISVKGINECGEGIGSAFPITVNTLPVAAEEIIGKTTVCQGETFVSYTVPEIDFAAYYEWTLPSGADGNSTTNTILVDFGSPAVSGDISVRGINDCGQGNSSYISVTVNTFPDNAGTISGAISVCQGETAVVYTVPEIMNAVSYEWILPVGVVGSSNTNTIELDFSDLAVSGDISVKGINECGEGGISSIYVNINEIPTISLVSTNCSADLKTYIAEFTANIGNVSVDVGNIDENRIFDIPVGTDITITVDNNGCVSSLFIESPDCPCPIIPLPENPNNPSVCEGSAIPNLTVEVPSEYAVNWFIEAEGGKPIASGSSFTPTDVNPGVYTYYAETEEIVSNCKSLRLPVTLTIIDSPQVDVLTDVAECDTYVLPELTNGNYYLQSGGVEPILAGSIIAETQTIWIYTESETIPKCTNESSFVVNISKSTNDIIAVAICEDDEYIFDNVSLKVAGEHEFKYLTEQGCDSIITVVLTVNPKHYEYIEANICEGDVYNYGDLPITKAGLYTFEDVTEFGCYSLVELLLSVNPLPTVVCPEDVLVNIKDNEFNLIGSPIDGVFEGKGVDNNVFYPAIAGAGDHLITFTYQNTETQCASTCSFTVSVYEDLYSSEADIIAFSLKEQLYESIIDKDNKTVHLEVVSGTDLSALVPTIEVSAGATINPNSGLAQDFSMPKTYMVTAEDGTEVEWTVFVEVNSFNVKFTQNIGTSILVSWTPVSNAASYIVHIREANTNNVWRQGLTDTNSRKITNLIPGQKYEVRILVYDAGNKLMTHYKMYYFIANEVNMYTSEDMGTALLLSWDNIEGFNQYIIQYRKPSDAAWLMTKMTNSNSIRLWQLNPGEEYDCRILGYKDGVYGGYTISNFISNNIQFKIEENTGNSAVISWVNQIPDANRFVLHYRKADTGDNWIHANTNTNSRQLLNLTPNTMYEFRLLGYFNDIYGGATLIQEFATAGGKSDSANDNQYYELEPIEITVFPNPFVEVVNIELNSIIETTLSYSIIDLAGKLIMNGESELLKGQNKISINTDALPAGMYILNATFEGEVKTFRIVK